MQRIGKNMKNKISLWRVLLLAFTMNALFSTTSYGGKDVEYLYDLQEATELKPQEFEATGGLFGTKLFGGFKNIDLFPLPMANSVGSTQMGNAITEISFPGKRISFDRHFRKATPDMDTSEVYLPVISKDVIGFAKPREFLLFDFKKKIHLRYVITPDISETIAKAAVVDAKRNLFLFEISGHTGKSPNPWDITSSLMLVDLSGEQAKVLKEQPLARYTLWYVVENKYFLYNFDKKEIKVLDMNLEPAHHPLADVISKHKDKIDFLRISAHPTLPFAFLWGGASDEAVVSWDRRRAGTPLVFLGKNITAKRFLFSPDGKWVAWKEGGVMGRNRTFVMPVSEKYPNYLGTPIKIVDDYFEDNKYAWTSNPVAFVGSSQETIFRCDLESQDFPEKGRMSFHDYIVQKDLEKLAKEKRQGLGK